MFAGRAWEFNVNCFSLSYFCSLFFIFCLYEIDIWPRLNTCLFLNWKNIFFSLPTFALMFFLSYVSEWKKKTSFKTFLASKFSFIGQLSAISRILAVSLELAENYPFLSTFLVQTERNVLREAARLPQQPLHPLRNGCFAKALRKSAFSRGKNMFVSVENKREKITALVPRLLNSRPQ